MSRSPDQNRRRTVRRIRIAGTCLLTLALGIPTWNWIAGWDSRIPAGVSNTTAAETFQAVGAATSDSPVSSENETPAGTLRTDAPAFEYLPRPTKQQLKIMAALDKPTRVDFADTPMDACIEYLGNYHKIGIWVMREALIEEGVDNLKDVPITLKGAGFTLRTILKLLLEPMQLTYVIEGDVMRITTSAKANEKITTRIYPVRDLDQRRTSTADQPLPDQGASRRGDLETAIAKTIAPDSWDDKQGTGSMTYVRDSGSLVIRQTAAVHEQVLQLLRDLREAKRAGLGTAIGPAAPRITWQLRGPQRAVNCSIVGIFDLDGDGEGDAKRFHELIAAAGGHIDNEVDEQGVLRVNGQIDDRPAFTEKTKFVVVGGIPQPAELSDPEEIVTSQKIGAYYADLEDEARVHGVRIVGLEEFLRYIGYEPVKGKSPKP